MKASLLLVVGFLLIGFGQCTFTCTPNSADSCAAVCEDGETRSTVNLNITGIVVYPHHISVTKSPDDNSISSFVFDCKGGAGGGHCGQGDEETSVCLTSTDNSKSSCGSINLADWDLVQTKPRYLFKITYKGGDCQGVSCKNSKFTFIQTTEDDGTSIDFTRVDQEGIGDVYMFDVSGPCVGQPNCVYKPKPKDISGYIGLILISLAIVATAAYCVIGCVVMYNVRGARGKEVIPQVEFWMTLPGLIKDGCKFTAGPILKRLRKDHEYSSI